MIVDDGVIKDATDDLKSLVAVEDFMVDDHFWRTFRATLLNGAFRTLH